MTSSTKPEVGLRDISRCRQRSSKPRSAYCDKHCLSVCLSARLKTTCLNFSKFRHVVFKIRERTDRQTDNAYRNTSHSAPPAKWTKRYRLKKCVLGCRFGRMHEEKVGASSAGYIIQFRGVVVRNRPVPRYAVNSGVAYPRPWGHNGRFPSYHVAGPLQAHCWYVAVRCAMQRGTGRCVSQWRCNRPAIFYSSALVGPTLSITSIRCGGHFLMKVQPT